MTRYKLVPVEPTPEMIEAAASFGGSGGYSYQRGVDGAKIYRDMLAAAPQPNAEPVAWMGVPVLPGRHKEAVFCSDKTLAMQWDYSGHLGLGRLIVTPLYTHPQPDDTALLRQALEALTSCTGVLHWPSLMPTIVALRERLGDKK